MDNGFLMDISKTYTCTWKGFDDDDDSFQCPGKLEFGVQRSAAGYYLGWFCTHCGPYSRESDYYATREAAQTGLDFLFEWHRETIEG